MTAIAALALTLTTLPLNSNSVKIEVAEAGWDSSSRDIHAVFQSVSEVMLKNFPDRKLSTIKVDRSHGSPITLYQQGPNGEILIQINSQGTYWSQFAYQFAHELTHVLCGFRKVEPNSAPNMWFEESICMMGSLYAMREMEKTWKTNPPYSNWKDYAPNLGSYAAEVINRPEHQLPKGKTLAQWYSDNEKSLRTGSTREQQSVVANVILPLFEQTPEAWPAIGYLNAKKTGDSTFKTYLDAWEESAPKKYAPFIKRVRSKLGQ